MPAININELRRGIPRYSNTINEPNVSLKYPDFARLRLSASASKSSTISGASNATPLYGYEPVSAVIVLCWFCASCGCGAIRPFARYFVTKSKP
jgi:hypothetical protein